MAQKECRAFLQGLLFQHLHVVSQQFRSWDIDGSLIYNVRKCYGIIVYQIVVVYQTRTSCFSNAKSFEKVPEIRLFILCHRCRCHHRFRLRSRRVKSFTLAHFHCTNHRYKVNFLYRDFCKTLALIMLMLEIEQVDGLYLDKLFNITFRLYLKNTMCGKFYLYFSVLLFTVHKSARSAFHQCIKPLHWGYLQQD